MSNYILCTKLWNRQISKDYRSIYSATAVSVGKGFAMFVTLKPTVLFAI